REVLAQAYLKRLADLPVQPLLLPSYPQQHAWHLFILRIDAERCGLDREAFMKGLQEQNIGTGIHFIATHLHTYYRKQFPSVQLPNTEWNSARLCSIPLFPDMTLDDVERVACAIETTLERSL
ncbi:DegT/DnrJ/EryC1/StrS family aminotransferase, partial [Pseudomonas sp. MH9.2]